MFLALAFTLGALVVSEQAVADEPKKEGDEYNEKVTIRQLTSSGPSTEAIKDVPAFRREKGKELWFYTKALVGATPNKGTEITDKDGNVYVVQNVNEMFGAGRHLSVVKLKSKPKDK
jgi:hypothetical protein